jgi:4-carboxymuconolactone decarboxylase
MEDKQRYQDGMAVRRKVLGDVHVDRTLQHLTPLNEEFVTLSPATPETRTRPITIPAA